MVFRFILLALPILGLAEINVRLSGNVLLTNVAELRVYFDGDEVNVITDTDRETFNLSDSILQNSTNEKRIDNIYLGSPNRSLYHLHSWQQVNKTIKPHGVNITKISYEPIVIFEQVFESNSTKSIIYNISAFKDVHNSVSSSWSTEGKLYTNQSINHDIVLEDVKFNEKINLSYNSPWGKNIQRLQNKTVGNIAELNLKPNQTVISQLHVIKGSIRLEVEYEAFLTGTVILSNTTHNDTQFWPVDVGTFMNNSHLINRKMSSEIIDVEFYTVSKIKLLYKI